MSNYGVTQRPSSTISSSTPLMETPHEPKGKSKLVFQFDLPPTPKAAVARIIKNLSHLGLLYMLVPWVWLSISLMRDNVPSMKLLTCTTIIANQCLIMVQLMPNSICGNKAVDKMLVLVPVAIVTIVGLILMGAATQLYATLRIGTPVILVHAMLWRDGGFINEEASASAPGELTPLMETPHEPKGKSKLVFPFDLPPTPKAAIARIIKNLSHLDLFYILVPWVGLSINLVSESSISLAPEGADLLLLLMAMTIITNQDLIMVRLMPNSICGNKAVDKMLLLVPVAIVTIVALILTQNVILLYATLGIGTPAILTHAVLWRDGGFINEEASAPGELTPQVDNV